MGENGVVPVEAPKVEETLKLFSGRKVTRGELDALLEELRGKLAGNPMLKRCQVKAFGSAWGVVIYRSCTRAEYKRTMSDAETKGKATATEQLAAMCTILPGGDEFAELAEALPGLPSVLANEILTLSGIDSGDSLKG